MSEYRTLLTKLGEYSNVKIEELALLHSMRLLPTLQRELVTEYYVAGKTKRAIATATGLSLYKVVQEINRAFNTLRLELNPEYKRQYLDACRRAVVE